MKALSGFGSAYIGPQKKQSSETDALVGKLIHEWQHLFGLRGTWNNHWTEIAQRIYPMEAWLFQNYSQMNSMGDKRNFEVFDSTGAVALQRFGAIMDSLLTPRNQFWHLLAADNPDIMKDKAVRLWFEDSNNKLFHSRYNQNANFASQNQKQYLSLGAYGTGLLFVDDLAGFSGIRYKHIHLGECYLQENHQGIIDGVCRHFRMTARQAVQKWGDKCPEVITAQLEKSPENPFYFLHWVRPRDDRDMDRKDFKGMPWASYYISIEGQWLLEEGGYRSFPYAASRYFQAPNETYGRGPAMDVLPCLKSLNEMKKAMLKQGHRVLDPVLLAHDDAVIDGFNLQPGAVNSGGVTADGRLLVSALPTGNVQAGKEMMDEERNLIKDTFLVSLFQILEENPQMTATEVMERVKEKGMLLAPTVGRQESEYLGPMIHRELDILSRQRILKPMPPLLREAKGEYKITFDTPISRTQRAESTAGVQRLWEVLVNVATQTQDPSIMDYVNTDVAVPKIAETFAVPPSFIRDPKEIAKIRQMRAKQQQIEQQIKAAPAAAGLAKAGMLPQQQSRGQRGGGGAQQ